MANKAMQTALILLFGAAVVFLVIQPAILAVKQSMMHSAECISNPSAETCHD